MDIIDRMFELVDKKYSMQKDFAEVVGVSDDTVSNWRRRISESCTKPKHLEKIAEALDTTVEYLYTGTPPGQAPHYVQLQGKILRAMDLTIDECRLIEAYRKADQRAKNMVSLALEPFGLSDTPEKAM